MDQIKKKILVVDDEVGLLEMLEMRLIGAGFVVITSFCGEDALEKIKDFSPDLILMDIIMPGMDGLTLKAKLNEDTSFSTIPVIFLTGKDEELDKIKGLNLGVDDYITKPFNSNELLARINSVLGRRDFYEKISMTDGLTGLFNVHYFKKEFHRLFGMAKRYKQVFSLMLVDVDNLKSVNDTYGHLAGDMVIKQVANVLQTSVRETDIVARYGGDEFIVLLAYAGKHDAVCVEKRIKEVMSKKGVYLDKFKKSVKLDVSAGIAVYDTSIEAEEKLFEMADAQMYEEKKKKHG